MSSIVARILDLKCADIYGNLDYVNPFVCATPEGRFINPYWVLTADIFIVFGILVLGYWLIPKIFIKIKERFKK
jgi:hypothetical protein